MSEFVPTVTTEALLEKAINSLFYNFSGILERFGRDLFFVDGDALLAHVLEESAPVAADFQLLPVIYRVEHALSRLVQLGAQFRVYFLGAYGRVGWRGPGALARAVLISHLSQIPSLKIDANVADFPWDAEWSAYRQLHLPSLIVTKEWVKLPRSLASPAVDRLMKCLALRELCDRIAVAFFSSPDADGRIDWCRDDVQVFSARPLESAEIRSTKKLLATAVAEYSERYAPSADDAPTITVGGDAVSRALAAVAYPTVAIGAFIAAGFAASSSMGAEHLEWLKCFVAALALTQTRDLSGNVPLSLSDRGFSASRLPAGTPVPGVESEDVLEALSSFVSEISSAFAVAITSGAIPPVHTASLCDVIDGRLLRMVRISQLASGVGSTFGGVFGLSSGAFTEEVTKVAGTAWAIVKAGMLATVPGNKDLVPLVADRGASGAASAYLESLAKDAATTTMSTNIAVPSVPFFNAILGIEGATAAAKVETVAAAASVASVPVTVELSAGDDGEINWEDDEPLGGEVEAETAAVVTATPTAAAASVIRPWLECSAPSQFDTPHGLLKIPDPLSQDFHVNHYNTSQYFANERKLKAESLTGGYVQSMPIHETSFHPWPFPIDAKKAGDDETRAAVSDEVIGGAGGGKKPTGAKGKPGKGKPGSKKPQEAEAEGRKSKADVIVEKNLNRMNKELLDEAARQLGTVMSSVEASEAVAHYERALVELDRFKPVGKDRTTPLKVSDFTDPAQIRDMQNLLLTVEEKRLRLTRFIWNRDVSELKVEMNRRKVDPITRRILLDKEAKAAAALYVIADNARKAWYAGAPESNPVHNLGKEIVQAFTQLGFLRAAASVQLPKVTRNNAAVKEAIEDGPISVPGIDIRFRESPALFQLAYMGPDMPRSVGSTEDKRVPFPPDRWQKELLDIVDARKSALVIAPTSSGKTFVSFYIMKLVLEERSSLGLKEMAQFRAENPGREFPAHQYPGVVLYVGPNKYLVRQVAAEVEARYSKRYDIPGMEMIGLLTTTDRDNVESCQVLITEPYCAELLTTSPHYRRVLSRVRYVIFDEVHNIVGTDGKVWENLLTLTNAPFVALSATVGNPKEFGDWLTSLELARGRPMGPSQIIEHKERFNDLKPFVWGGAVPTRVFQSVLEPDGSLRKLTTVRESLGQERVVKFSAKTAVRDEMGLSLMDVNQVTDEQLARSPLSEINPVGLLNLDALDYNAIRTDVAAEVTTKALELLPEDCPRLYFQLGETLKATGHADLLSKLAALDPDTYFPDGVRISMSEAHEYGRKLMAILMELAACDRPAAEEILNKLGESSANAFAHVAECLQLVEPRFYCKVELFALMRDLMARKMLPAIVFHMDPFGCDKYAKFLLDELVRQETEQRKLEGWDVKLREADVRRQEIAVLLQELNKDPLAKRVGSKIDQQITALEIELASLPHEYDIDSRFTFTSPEIKPKVSLIAQCMQRRSLGLENVRDDWRLHALMRGIGVHHNDISSGLRNTVEVMFRKKQLCIVFAISTLAQGIHMPCPTVVFFGDSEELNATTYRQMSGRAGRRGFDKRGNVVFAGLPRHKIERLLNSKLPPLIGTTPIDSNMLLRTLVLHDVDAVRDKDRGSEWIEESKEEAVEGTKRLLTLPFVSRINPEATSLQKQQVKFTAEFLRRLNLLNSAGGLVDIAGLALHLYHDKAGRNSSAFVFTHLLRSGVLNDLPRMSKAVRVKNLLSIISYLFFRLPVHATYAAKYREGSARFIMYPSDVPEKVRDAVATYNAHVRALFLQHLKDFVAHADHDASFIEAASQLPMSRLSFPTAGAGNVTPGGAVSALRSASRRGVLRSPLLCMLGNGDDFATVTRLASELRGGMFVSPMQVPVFDEGKWILNGYIRDFYDVKLLQALKPNGLSLHEANVAMDACRLMCFAFPDALCRVDGVFQRSVVEAFKKREEEAAKRRKAAKKAKAAAAKMPDDDDAATAATSTTPGTGDDDDASSDEEADVTSGGAEGDKTAREEFLEAMQFMFIHMGHSFRIRFEKAAKKAKMLVFHLE